MGFDSRTRTLLPAAGFLREATRLAPRVPCETFVLFVRGRRIEIGAGLNNHVVQPVRWIFPDYGTGLDGVGKVLQIPLQCKSWYDGVVQIPMYGTVYRSPVGVRGSIQFDSAEPIVGNRCEQ